MKKKTTILLSTIALVCGTAIAVVLYCISDHEPPELKAVDTYHADCGTSVTVDELVTEVQDQSHCTLTLSGKGQVAEDGRSICFTKVGTFTVVVEATDERGKSTKVKVPITTKDVTAPELKVRDIVVELGETIDYTDAVSAVDESDGDLSAQVQVDDKRVNKETVGTYSVVYTVTDRSGNSTEERGRVIIQPVSATDITLDQSELSLSGNQYTTLQATVNPSDWTGKVEWSSDDPSIATVSDGLIAWAGKGSCKITASADGKTATCTVKCGGVAATSVRLDRYEVALTEGEVTTLTADPAPSNWKGDISWRSSDKKIATVKNGKVTAVGLGNCTITATAGEVKAVCKITCHGKNLVDDVSDLWHSFIDHS